MIFFFNDRDDVAIVAFPCEWTTADGEVFEGDDAYEMAVEDLFAGDSNYYSEQSDLNGDDFYGITCTRAFYM